MPNMYLAFIDNLYGADDSIVIERQDDGSYNMVINGIEPAPILIKLSRPQALKMEEQLAFERELP